MKLSVEAVTVWAENFEDTRLFYERILELPDVPQESDGVVHFPVDGVYFTLLRGTASRVSKSGGLRCRE